MVAGAPDGQHRADCRVQVGRRSVLAEMGQHQPGRQHRARRVRQALAGDVRRRAVHRLEDRRPGAIRVQVAARRVAKPAGQGRAQVGDDVAEQVVGDDHVEPLRVVHHPQARRVHVRVAELDAVLGRYLVGDPVPQVAGMCEHVGLVHQRQPAAAPDRELRCVPDAAPHASPGVQRLLGRRLELGAPVHGAASARVQALGVLPDDDEVQIRQLVLADRTANARPQLGRPQVDVEVELEPQPQQQPPLQHARRHLRRADRAEQDGVGLPQLCQHGVRQYLAGLQVVLATQVAGSASRR